MSADRLKVIAEGMGYFINCYYDVEGELSSFDVSRSSDGEYHKFNPLENPAQDAEIELRLKAHTWWNEGEKIWESYTAVDKNKMGLGKTPQEARLNLAWEYFK